MGGAGGLAKTGACDADDSRGGHKVQHKSDVVQDIMQAGKCLEGTFGRDAANAVDGMNAIHQVVSAL